MQQSPSSLRKPIPKVCFFSPPKSKEFSPIQAQHQYHKPKAYSFNVCSQQPLQHNTFSNPFFTHPTPHEKFALSAENFYPGSSQKTNNLPNEFKQQKQINPHVFDQKKTNFAHLEKQVNKTQAINEPHLDKGYFMDRLQYFESLRTTLTVPHPTIKINEIKPFQIKTTQNWTHSPINELNKQNKSRAFFKKQKVGNQKSLLTPSRVANLGLSFVNERSKTKSKPLEPKNQHFVDTTTPNDFSRPRYLSSHLQSLKQNNQTCLQQNYKPKAKNENKFPSFLSSRLQKRDEKAEPKGFKRFSPLSFHPQGKDPNKKFDNKKLVNSKHAKSFSVFETVGIAKSKLLNKSSQPLDTSEITPKEPETPRTKVIPRQKSISIQEHKIRFFEALHADQKFSKTGFEHNKLKGSFSLRQSLDKFPFHSKSFKKMQYKKQDKHEPNPKQNAVIDENLLIKAQPCNYQKQQQRQNTKIYIQPLKLDLQESVKEIQSNLPKKQSLQTIDDIKQTLINCDLFSQQDYKGVFESHKKDILKQNKSQKKTQTVKFMLQPLQNKTSLKDLVDPSDGSQSLRSTEQRKRLAQMAQMCQQKRSKWILDQTDTIKQSLKELSQFNTEKSLYQNEWKKISMKDFISSRNHRCSAQIQNIDEVKEEEVYFQAKSNILISEGSLSSETSADNNCKNDQRKDFKKVRVNQVQCGLVQERYHALSLDDFSLRWCSEEQIMQGNSQFANEEKTFITFWAHHKQTHTLYTIKKYEKKVLKELGKEYMQIFIKKLKMQTLLMNHPYIQKIYCVFSDELNIYLLCEFTEITLSEILSQRDHQNLLNSSQQSICLNTLTKEKQKADLLKEIIDGLEEIHLNNVVHRSLQPNNIRIICDSCKISGFENAQYTQKSINKLYSSYVCPQSLFDSSKTAMDIWCLGIMAYELLVGKKPFHQENDQTGNTVRKILQCNFDLPSDKAELCEQVLNMALKRNPKDRACIFDIKNVWMKKIAKFYTELIDQTKLNQEFSNLLQS